MTEDRRTTIDADQIKDETLTRDELKFENSPTDDSLVSVNQSTGEFKYKNFPIFSTYFQEASDLTLSQTTSESFQQKLRMTTPSLPVGKYRIGFVYTWQYGLASNDFKARIQVNDTDTIMQHQEEPKDQFADQIRYNSGFIYYNVSVAGVLNIDLDYCGNSGNTASIANVRLEIWRVS
ncbi:MAG: hypothetical protein R6U15_08350 [Candidatus Izemoplasmatales bacterium]